MCTTNMQSNAYSSVLKQFLRRARFNLQYLSLELRFNISKIASDVKDKSTILKFDSKIYVSVTNMDFKWKFNG